MAISAPGSETQAIGSSEPIAEDERRFRRLVDANVVGVTISDDERVLESNDAWLAIVGRTREELEAGTISWRAITAPEWAAQDDHVTRRLDAEGWVAPYEKEYMRPDGTRAPVLISGVTLDRNPLRVVAVVIDLSERRAADRERELLLAREREARREAELSADRTSRLQRATAALSAASSAEDVGEVVVGQAVEAFFAAAGALAFRDGDEVEIAHDRGFEDTKMAPWRRFHMRLDSPVCDVLRTGEPVYLETLDDWERYADLRSGITGIFQAMVVVPLSFGGAVSGALVLCNTDARRFMAADRAFLASLADQAAHALERARLYEERAYVARTLQAGLLPERLADVPGLEVAVRYHSIADGGSVGGDFYDCFDISPARWLVAVGDVAGKGTAAAVLTGLARHTLRAIALRDERPEDMLRFLNEALRRQSATSAFCTVGCATLDVRDGGGFDVRLASGGHPYPLLVREGGDVEEVVVRGTLLGVEADPMLEPASLALEPGDTLVLYTDGMTDARDPSGERFGEERLIAALQVAARGDGAEAVAAALDEMVAAFDQDSNRDDRAIVVLRVSR
jgi:PAS domain S-box-containing protein